MNPLNGIVRGEAVLDGDASEGIDVVLYAVTKGWDAIAPESGMLATGGQGRYVSVAGGEPFVTAMIGKTITFETSGAAEITDVLASNEIKISSDILLDPLTGPRTEAFSMMGEEALREVTLDADDELHITDVSISQEKDSEYALVECTDTPGSRIVKGRLLELGTAREQYRIPYVCRPGCTLKYFGHEAGLNVCLIHGAIT